MNPSSLADYVRLYHAGEIAGLVPESVLVNAFPTLRVRDTFDFNHFWVYSLLASVIGKAAALIGLRLSAHSAFLILHMVLLAIPSCLALRWFGARGAAVVIAMTIASPLLWFLDKVHTELFTYSLVLSAVILVMGRSVTWAAFCLALASTQNPPLALVAGFLLATRLFWWGRQPFSALETMVVAAAAITLLLHPAYYFLRFGVPTPQLQEEGAALGANLGYFYIWLFDPDVGLLPNWPAGLVVVIAGIAVLCVERWPRPIRPEPILAVFASVYMAVCFYGHSSTTNINSGATRGLARYALWYIPLAFPFALLLAEHARHWGARWRSGLAAVLALLAVPTMVDHLPWRPESFLTPSWSSRLIQTRASWLYNPPPEVFAERYGWFGNGGVPRTVSVMVGPDCRKVLLAPGPDRPIIASPADCAFDPARLAAALEPVRAALAEDSYVRMTDAMVDAARLRLDADRAFAVSTVGDGGGMIGTGWSVREAWGVWSDGPSAGLRVMCPVGQGDFRVTLRLHAFTAPGKPSNVVTAMADGRTLWSATLAAEPTDATLVIPRSACSGRIAPVILTIADTRSPRDLGLSTDGRQLGVGLTRITYPAAPQT